MGLACMRLAEDAAKAPGAGCTQYSLMLYDGHGRPTDVPGDDALMQRTCGGDAARCSGFCSVHPTSPVCRKP